MISADKKTDVKLQKTGSCIFVPYQILKYNLKQTFIFHSILVGNLSNLVLSVKKRGWGLFNKQNPWQKLFVDAPLDESFSRSLFNPVASPVIPFDPLKRGIKGEYWEEKG